MLDLCLSAVIFVSFYYAVSCMSEFCFYCYIFQLTVQKDKLFCWMNQVDVVYNVDEIYRRTRFGCFSNYGFAVLKVIFDGT